MGGYKELEIYRLAHALAVEVHSMSIEHLPRSEQFEEGSQIRRSSKSVVANIVEGFGRRCYKQEFLLYLVYAHASCDETKEHLDLLFETGSLKNRDLHERLTVRYMELGSKLSRFIAAVRAGHKTRQRSRE